MPQKYKVYFANRPVVFLNAEDGEQSYPYYEVIPSQGKTDTMLIEHAIERGVRGIVLSCSDVEWSWKQFATQFLSIRAAGGVVYNQRDEVLFIHRLDKWDLPKGKVESGESLELAAVREVEEECSIHQLKLEKHLVTTYHTYPLKGEQVLKSTDWFVMKHEGNEQPEPQAIEGITEARWIAPNDWKIVESNTFPSVLDVLRAFEASR